LTQPDRLLVSGDGLRVLTLRRINTAEAAVHVWKVLILFDGLLQSLNRLIVLAGIAEPFTNSGLAEGR
jgi:hypothetical protein